MIIKKIKLLMILLISIFIITGCATTPNTNNSMDNTVNQKQPSQTTQPSVSNNSEKQNSSSSKVLKVPAIVISAIDGDTVKVSIEGQEETIRMLLIDTPETSHPRLGVQPFGPEAKEFAKKTLIKNKPIELEFDVSGMSRDKYGRLLAYVWVDGKMFNEMQLEKGYARVAYIYQPNVRHVDKFREIQDKARQQGIGIWSVENYTQDDGFHKEAVEKSDKNNSQQSTVVSSPSTSNKGDCNIKGNISSRGDKIYHIPSGQFYEQTKAEEMFCSEEDAQKAGFRKSQR